MTAPYVLAGVAVSNLDDAIAWYSRLFNRRPDALPMPDVAEWRFPEGARLGLFADAERAGSASITFDEPDLSFCVQALRQEGIALVAEASSATAMTATVSDPDGNQLVFSQAR